MFKKTLKKILKKTGYTIHKYNKDNVCTNFNDFTPFQDGQNKNKSLYYEAIEKSQNLQSDNFSKRLRYYSLNQLVDFVLKKENVSDFVECGCWKGHSAYMISKLILASKKKINFHILVKIGLFLYLKFYYHLS